MDAVSIARVGATYGCLPDAPDTDAEPGPAALAGGSGRCGTSVASTRRVRDRACPWFRPCARRRALPSSGGRIRGVSELGDTGCSGYAHARSADPSPDRGDATTGEFRHHDIPGRADRLRGD